MYLQGRHISEGRCLGKEAEASSGQDRGWSSLINSSTHPWLPEHLLPPGPGRLPGALGFGDLELMAGKMERARASLGVERTLLLAVTRRQFS